MGDQVCVTIAPRFQDRPGTPGHRRWRKVCHPPEATIVGEQKFTTPDGAVRAKPQPVQRDTDHRPGIQRMTAVGQDTGDVCEMVLYRYQFQTLPFGQDLAIARRAVVRVQVHRHDAGLMLEQLAVQIDSAFVVVGCARVLEVTQVLRQHCLPVLEQTQGVLELAAKREYRGSPPESGRQHQWRRRIAAGTPQQAGLIIHHAHHRIIHAVHDLAVVQQIEVRYPIETPSRVVVRGALRLITEIAAGHHQRRVPGFKQQVMQRAVWQHEAERRLPGGHIGRQHRCLGRRQQHHRCCGRPEQGAFVRVHTTIAIDHREITRHQGERLPIASFSPPQQGNRIHIAGVTRQVKPANSLDREDPALSHKPARRGDGVPGGIGGYRHAECIDQPDPRTAFSAGVRLRMKTPVRRIAVFVLTGRTHREVDHAGVGTIVGDAVHDAEPRATVSTVRERVAEAPIGRIKDLVPARGAGYRVGHNAGMHLSSITGQDSKARRGFERLARDRAFQRIDARQRRALVHQPGNEVFDRPGLPLQPDQYTCSVVTHVTRQATITRQTPHRRPKADTLHQAAHAYRFKDQGNRHPR